jgi:hypothetical protein
MLIAGWSVSNAGLAPFLAAYRSTVFATRLLCDDRTVTFRIWGASFVPVNKGRSLSCLAVALSLFALGPGRAWATTTVCSNEAARQYHYGDKRTLKFEIPSADPGSITEQVKAYAANNNLSYSSVGGHDPYKTPPLESRHQILQSQSVDVSITISTTNRDNIATATIATFSFSCGATEDWRPYWRAFEAFVAAQKYPLVSDPPKR